MLPQTGSLKDVDKHVRRSACITFAAGQSKAFLSQTKITALIQRWMWYANSLLQCQTNSTSARIVIHVPWHHNFNRVHCDQRGLPIPFSLYQGWDCKEGYIIRCILLLRGLNVRRAVGSEWFSIAVSIKCAHVQVGRQLASAFILHSGVTCAEAKYCSSFAKPKTLTVLVLWIAATEVTLLVLNGLSHNSYTSLSLLCMEEGTTGKTTLMPLATVCICIVAHKYCLEIGQSF